MSVLEVTSSSGLVGLKNQFRQQRRDLEREQMERKDSERRAHTFQQQVQQLQLWVVHSDIYTMPTADGNGVYWEIKGNIGNWVRQSESNGFTVNLIEIRCFNWTREKAYHLLQWMGWTVLSWSHIRWSECAVDDIFLIQKSIFRRILPKFVWKFTCILIITEKTVSAIGNFFIRTEDLYRGVSIKYCKLEFTYNACSLNFNFTLLFKVL